jgi:serine phosphatase RsbU (regulator of sigma subunit)
MRSAPQAQRLLLPAVRTLPWLVLIGITTVLIVVMPTGHYGLLLVIAPFIASAVHGAQITMLVGVLTVALYGFLHVVVDEDVGAVVWIKLGLVGAAAAVATLTSRARYRERELARTRDLALTLQRELLPAQSPGTSTVDLCHGYVPADTEAGVGGDWFDAVPLSGTRLALVIGDVAGHGLHAAALMGRLRTAVHTLAELDLSPDELLTRMDGLAARLNDEDDSRDLTATCLYLVYDPVTRQCTVASAGHTPPALRLPDGTVDFVQLPEHPPLGMGDTAFESVTLTLDEDTVIALYTDGVLNLRRHDTEAALARLAAALAPEAPDLKELCDRICGTVPTDSDDDVALLVARVHAMPDQQVATWRLPADPKSVRRARDAAGRQLDEWGLEELAFGTELVISELVTNALLHGSAPITLRLVKDSVLVCEISDCSHTAPHPRHARDFDEGGRGLELVAQLTTRWGTRYTDDGKTIWTEQALPAPPRSPAPAARVGTMADELPQDAAQAQGVPGPTV